MSYLENTCKTCIRIHMITELEMLLSNDDIVNLTKDQIKQIINDQYIVELVTMAVNNMYDSYIEDDEIDVFLNDTAQNDWYREFLYEHVTQEVLSNTVSQFGVEFIE